MRTYRNEPSVPFAFCVFFVACFIFFFYFYIHISRGAAAATAEKLANDKEGEKQSRLQIAAAMKEAKVTEQQRAKKQQQLRKQATHLENIREKAEKALQEANAIRAKSDGAHHPIWL